VKPRFSILASCTLAITLALTGSGWAAPDQSPVDRIEVFPAELNLASRHHPAQLLVTGVLKNGRLQDLTSVAVIESADPAIVEVRAGRLWAQADGQARITVKAGGQRYRLPLTVKLLPADQTAGFKHGTQAALTRHGCNSGGCHGAPSGKASFRLSLWAYDTELDAESVVREFAGRRVDSFMPANSLLLRKPTMKVPHGGGKRLRKDDSGYRLLYDWIAGGCRLDLADAAECERIEVYPQDRQLAVAAPQQQLSVRGFFSDGSVRDLTSLVLYSSSDDTIATVSEEGQVEGSAGGEVAILVSYLEHVATSRLAFVKADPEFAWQAPAASNDIDELVFTKLRRMQVLPSARCSDEVFIRRLYLDLAGVPPTAEQARAFLADKAADKRSQLVDQLLDSADHVAWWANKWGDLLRIRSETMTDKGVFKFYRWLQRSVQNNVPYDQFVRQLLLAQGSSLENPAVNFYRSAASTDDCTETMAQLFLGSRLQCAKCHNHPYERWTQDNYYGFGAFFHRLQRTTVKETGEMVLWSADQGEIVQPRTSQQMQPWVPGAAIIATAESQDRRQLLVDWMTQDDNPYLARVEVNRIWGELFGRGIVDPVDDFRGSNPASNQQLLDWLARRFVQSGFDRREMIRLICNSTTYQLSSKSLPSNENDMRYFARMQPRHLAAESMMESVCQITGVPFKFEGLPASVRAIGIPSPKYAPEFLQMFGKPPRETNCACERSASSNLNHALSVANGTFVYHRIIDKNNLFRRLLKEGISTDELVDHLYLAGYARYPTDEERRYVIEHVEKHEESEEGWEDVIWAIVNSKEFAFQH
jgi:hypothetical protein